MRLIQQLDITIQDIPFIEGKYFALHYVKKALQEKNEGLSIICNLEDFLNPDNNLCGISYGVDWRTDAQIDNHQLIREIECGLILLVHISGKAFSPIVEFIPNTEGNVAEGHWQIEYNAGIFDQISPYIRSLVDSMPNNRTLARGSGFAAGPGNYQYNDPVIPTSIVKPTPLPDTRTQKWLQVEIYDDNTGLPVPGVTLNIEVPTGSKKPSGPYRSDAAGHIDVLSLASGKCSIESMVFQSYKNTLAYVRNGKPGTQSTDSSKKLIHGDFTIAQIEEYKVKAGDTLASIAAEKGVSEKDIGQFNWQTTNQQEINQHLIEDVGGVLDEGEQGEVSFSAEADPGIILIPLAWENNAVSTMTTLSLIVRQVKPAKPAIIIAHQFDLDAPDAQDDLFILETTDGQWRQVIQASSLKEVVEDWVILRFEDPPKDASFNLIHDLNDEYELTQYIFEDYGYNELKEATSL